MLAIGDSVYFTPTYQRLLYAKGYKGALCPLRVLDRVSDTQVRVEVERNKRAGSINNHLIVTSTCVVKHA